MIKEPTNFGVITANTHYAEALRDKDSLDIFGANDETVRGIYTGDCVDAAMNLIIAGIEEDWEPILEFVFQHFIRYDRQPNPNADPVRSLDKLGHRLSSLTHGELTKLAGIEPENFIAKINELLEKYGLSEEAGYSRFIHVLKITLNKKPSTDFRDLPEQKVRRIVAEHGSDLKLDRYAELGGQVSEEDLPQTPDLNVKLAGYMVRITGGRVDMIDPAISASDQLMVPKDRFDYSLQLMLSFIRGSRLLPEQS